MAKQKKKTFTDKDLTDTKRFSIKELCAKYPIKYASAIGKEERVKTGIFAMDYVLCGGVSLSEGGHRIEFWGKESSYKTTFTLKLIAQYQKLGKRCMFIDAEASFDESWAKTLGVDPDKLVLMQPEYLEQVGDVMIDAIPNFDLIVVDSLSAMIPKAELEGSMEDRTMGLQAQLLSILCRKIYTAIKGRTTTLVFINQVREKLTGYGNPYVQPSGHAIKHLVNTILEFKPVELIEQGTKDEKEFIGSVIAIKCTKNKKGKPNRVSTVDVYYDGHIDNQKSLLYAGIKYGIVKQSGSFFQYKDKKIQGESNFCFELTENEWKQLEEEIWTQVK